MKDLFFIQQKQYPAPYALQREYYFVSEEVMVLTLFIRHCVLGTETDVLYPLSNPQQPFEANIVLTIL